jgi:tRNA A-37 threonylcarbamoyl transferase component Bud32
VPTRIPVVELENAIGAQLLLAQFSSGPAPIVARRYEILELRGRGASGLVCRARDTKLHRIVALKLYPRSDDPTLERETLREAQALARLEHPNVVRIHDHDRGVIEAGDVRLPCLFVSMEFIEGRHLKAWLAESRRSRNEILRALVAAGNGLAAAHHAGLIHRDFKPENVMIDVDGQVRVVDFGLARSQSLEASDDGAMVDPRASPDLVSQRITRAGVAPGTPEYMAPEALGGRASASSDQFSFAMSAWESLTGHLPTDRFGETDESASGSDSGGRLPPRARAALERALAFEPDRRYAELDQLLEELRRVMQRGRTAAIVGVATFAISMLVLGGWAFRADTLEEAAAVSASRADEDPRVPSNGGTGDAQCSDLVGLWHYDTVVVWASDSVRWYGATGHYELQLEQLGGCSMNAALEKVGDGPRRYAKNLVREGARGVRIEQTARGLEFSARLSIASDKFGKLTYAFNYVFADDQVSGDFEYLGEDGVIWRGILQGGRTVPGDALQPDVRQGSCVSQCRIRCPSESSRDACIASRCLSESDVLECGRPGVDETSPPLTLELVGASVTQLRNELSDETARKWCSKAAEAVRGRWQLSSPTWTRELDVRATNCDLTIVDPTSGERLSGLTTSTGAWVIHEPGRNEIRWALVGWDPAFGSARGGTPLSAHRKSGG